jgi:hypothetical protein
VGAEVDVLDDGRLTQPGLAQAAGEPLVLAAGRLAIDEQPEPILAGWAPSPASSARQTEMLTATKPWPKIEGSLVSRNFRRSV